MTKRIDHTKRPYVRPRDGVYIYEGYGNVITLPYHVTLGNAEKYKTARWLNKNCIGHYVMWSNDHGVAFEIANDAFMAKLRWD